MTLANPFTRFIAAMGLCLVVVCPVAAQDSPQSLRGLLRSIGGPLGSEQGLSALESLATLEVSTAPLGTSTGGFTFRFDPLIRTWMRSATSFGPAFAERSLTTGKGRISGGFNFLHSNYAQFNNQNLKNGEFRPAQNIRGFAPLPAVSHSALTLNMSSDVLVVYGHAGITDDFDVGVAVPWISISLEATGGLFNPGGTSLTSFRIPTTTSSGVGDIAVFGKYRVLPSEGGGLAVAVEMRMPTGDKDSLRGLDVTRTLTSVIWSRAGRISPHVNVGYELWTDGVAISSTGDVYARNQFKYAFGAEVAASPRLTVVLDIVGRQLRYGGKVGYKTFFGPAGSSVDALVGLPEGLHAVSAAPGVKWNVWRSMLLAGHVLVSMSNSGLRATLTPVGGIDWAF